jgi:hypothetical protein
MKFVISQRFNVKGFFANRFNRCSPESKKAHALSVGDNACAFLCHYAMMRAAQTVALISE